MASACEETSVSVETVIEALKDASTKLKNLIDESEKSITEKGIDNFANNELISLFPAVATVVTLATKLGCNSAESLTNTLQEVTSKEGDNDDLLTALEDFNMYKQTFDDFLQTIDDRLTFEKLETPLELSELELSHSVTSEIANFENLISKSKLTWFVFLRNYFCPICIRHVKALADAKDKLYQLQCQVILVAPGEPKGSELFKADVPSPFELYLDTSESKKVYLNYGLKRTIKKIFGSQVWPLMAEFILTGGVPGKAYEGIKDEPLQMGGDFVLESTGEILYSNVSRNVFDRPKIPTVMTLLQSTKL